MTRGISLRDRLGEGTILTALGAHDGLTARIAEQGGIEALYQGGYSLAAHHFGLPDIGLVGLSDVIETTTRIRAATTLPLIVDADTGYGAEPGVRRTVMALEAAGASAVQLEDQTFPKRCGHMAGKDVIPRDDMIRKVRAAVAARRDPETVIIARTDALQVTGFDDAVERCNAYADAGADVVFVDAPRTREEVVELAKRIDAPCLSNMSETGRTPPMTAEELQAIGYRIVIFPSTQTWLFAKAYAELVAEVRRSGTTQALVNRFLPFDEINSLLRQTEWEAPA